MIYLQFPLLELLNTLAFSDTVTDAIYVSIICMAGVVFDYLSISKLRLVAIRDCRKP